MKPEIRHLFIEIKKKGDSYDATLSDDSLDRDGEFFAPELLAKWAQETTPIPFLANHDNSMESFIGGWFNRRLEKVGENMALKMEPKFFSEKANPLAQRIKNQIDEALAMGLDVGLSIGFIPQSGTQADRGYKHIQAELVEGSAAPVQSNRHAAISLAKSLRLKTDIFKKEGSVIGAGGKMADDGSTKATPEEMMAALIAKVDAQEGRIAALEAAKTAAEAEGGKSLEEIKAKLAEKEKNDKDTAEKISVYEKKFEEMKKNLERPRGKTPASMNGNTGVGKDQADKEKKFSATIEMAKHYGIEVPED